MGWCIYTLSDPVTRIVRYVGKATDAIRRRKGHIWEARSGKFQDRKNRWLRSLLHRGLEPVQCVVESGTGQDSWQEPERRWIAFYRAWGGHIVNCHEGGIGGIDGRHPPEETRRKVSASLQGRVISPETRKRMSEAQRGKYVKPWTDEQRAKFHDAMVGHPVSAETRAKLSGPHPNRGRTGHVVTAETREKISSAKMGHSVTPEARAKMSAKAKVRSTSARMSEMARKGNAKRLRERLEGQLSLFSEA